MKTKKLITISLRKTLNAVTLSFYRFYWILALKELFMRESKDVFLALELCVGFFSAIWISQHKLFVSLEIVWLWWLKKVAFSLCVREVFFLFWKLPHIMYTLFLSSFALTISFVRVSIEGSDGQWLLSISRCNYNLIVTTMAAAAAAIAIVKTLNKLPQKLTKNENVVSLLSGFR